jgi:hypothetical protein
MMEEPQNSRRFKSFLNPRGVIFAICLVNVLAVLLMTWVRIRQWKLAGQATGFTVTHSRPVMTVEPLLLLGAAVGLLVNRWWSVLLAMLTSLRVIYLLAYLPWVAVYLASGVPMFSWQAVEKLWALVYQPRPQYLVALALAVVIFAYAVLLSLRFVNSRTAGPTHE